MTYDKYCITKTASHLVRLGAPPKVVKVLKKKAKDEWNLRDKESDLLRTIDVKYLKSNFRPVGYLKPSNPSIDAIYGALYGDIVGSKYEGKKLSADETKVIAADGLDSGWITDDSALTIATADALTKILSEKTKVKQKSVIAEETIVNHYTLIDPRCDMFATAYRQAATDYPNAGYGWGFRQWVKSDSLHGYGSRGNGSAMRISPIGAAGLSYGKTAELAIASAASTHDTFEGIRGAIVEAIAIRLACQGKTKDEIFDYMKKAYSGPGLNLFHEFTLEEARNINQCPLECQFSVPAAIIAVHESSSFNEAIANALLAGRDTDTNAAIAGAVAGTIYGIQEETKLKIREKLDGRQLLVLNNYEKEISHA